MCLCTIKRIYKKHSDEVLVGYKEFDKHDNGSIHGPFHGGPYVRRRWYESLEGVIYGDGGDYPAGFHIFTTKEAAVEYAGSNTNKRNVRKVFYKHVLVKGTQYGVDGDVVVTRFMRIA